MILRLDFLYYLPYRLAVLQFTFAHLLTQFFQPPVVMMPNISQGLPELFANFCERVAFVKMKSQCFMLLCSQIPHHLLETFSSQECFDRRIVCGSCQPRTARNIPIQFPVLILTPSI